MNTVQQLLQQWDLLLESQSLETLQLRENGQGWTLGQLFMHLVQSTVYFSKQINTCLQSEAHQDEPLLPKAAVLFKAGSLPDKRIDGPASNSQTPEPESIAYLHDSFRRLIEKFGQLESAIAAQPSSGKARHPGDLGYFDAGEWMQFTAMHLQHHFGQYDRIIRANQQTTGT